MSRLLLWLLMVPTLGLAQDERSPLAAWYAGVKGGAIYSQNSRMADSGSLIGLELGRNLNADWAFELEATFDSTDFDAGFELEQQALQFNLVQVNRVPLWNPYFLLGVGALRYEALGQDEADLVAAVAVGGMWDLNNYGLMLRVEARYRYSNLDNPVVESGEPIVTVGLVFPLGR